MHIRLVSLILAVAICVYSVGCQSASTCVCEYKTGCPTTQTVVTTPGVFALYNSSTEVTEVFVDRESPVGFRRDGNQLMAIAGPYEWQLIEAPYTWRCVPTPREPVATGAKPTGQPVSIPDVMLQATLGAIGVVIVVPIVLACWCAQGWYKSSGGQ